MRIRNSLLHIVEDESVEMQYLLLHLVYQHAAYENLIL